MDQRLHLARLRVLRISLSNWSTTDEDVTRKLEAIRRASTGA